MLLYLFVNFIVPGKCDEVMALMMSKLSLPIPEYNPSLDPIFIHATRLHSLEAHTYSTAALEPPDEEREINKRSGEEANPEQNPKRLCEGSVEKNSQLVNDKLNKEKEKTAVEENGALDSVASKDKEGSEVNASSSLREIKGSSSDEENKQISIKEEPKEMLDGIKKEDDNLKGISNSENKDESNVSTCKLPVKGIWRPFSFEDNGSSSSSFGLTKTVELKSEFNSPPTTSSNSMKTHTVSELSSKISSVDNMTKPTYLTAQNSVKKCLIQIEPLDLSCGKNRELETKPNPYFCKYCRVHYHSGVCLFYRKQQSENPPDPPCYCCDEEDEKDPLSPETDAKSPDDSDKSSKTPITNPGWFGKGYRKKIRKKR